MKIVKIILAVVAVAVVYSVFITLFRRPSTPRYRPEQDRIENTQPVNVGRNPSIGSKEEIPASYHSEKDPGYTSEPPMGAQVEKQKVKEIINYEEIILGYATNRGRTDSENPKDYYNGERGLLKYGTCMVTIPRKHKKGGFETTFIKYFEDPEKHILFRSVTPYTECNFYKYFKNRFNKESSALIFIHGFNVKFFEAAERTAQLKYDLEFKGQALFFSWPSKGGIIPYESDVTNADYSKADLVKFLKDFIQKVGVKNIYIIGHSMGNRLLTASLEDLYEQLPESRSRIKEVIIAAADIDSEGFYKNSAPKIISACRRITVYGSNTDWAIWLSGLLTWHSRLGSGAKNQTLGADIDFIDASGIDFSIFGLNHSYLALNTVMLDIGSVIDGRPPENRSWLRKMLVNQHPYWKMEKTQVPK